MSHPSSSDMEAGRNDNVSQKKGLLDSSSKTSSYGSIQQHDRSTYISVNNRTPLLGRRPTHQRRGINIGILALGVLFLGGVTIGTYLLINEDRPYITNYPFELVYRESWDEVNAIYHWMKINSLLTHNVYITHTGGSNCYVFEDCVHAVRNLQNHSIYSSETIPGNLPFNFLIGGDGKTYEIRGWNYEMGLDSIGLDPTTSILIGLIGNFTYTEPDTNQLKEIKSLLLETQRRNKLSINYNVYALRNVTISLVDGLELIIILRKILDNFRYIIEVT